jgi:hypothetical protein
MLAEDSKAAAMALESRGGLRVSLKPGQLVHLDGSQRQSMGLLCGADASSLAVTAPAELILN